MSDRRMYVRPNTADLKAFITKATELYQAGASLRQVAKTLDCPYTTLHSRLTAAGIHRRPRSTTAPIPADQHPELRRRYEAGETIHEIAATLGCTGSKVAHALRRAGTLMRPAGNRSTRIGGM